MPLTRSVAIRLTAFVGRFLTFKLYLSTALIGMYPISQTLTAPLPTPGDFWRAVPRIVTVSRLGTFVS